MTSFHSWDKVKGEAFDAEDLEAITAGARRMVAEARAHRLAEMRRQLGLTQREVADRMHVRQDRVSAIERGRTKSAEVGTVAACVEALGGELEIVANFNGTRVVMAWPGTGTSPSGRGGASPLGWITSNLRDGWGG